MALYFLKTRRVKTPAQQQKREDRKERSLMRERARRAQERERFFPPEEDEGINRRKTPSCSTCFSCLLLLFLLVVFLCFFVVASAQIPFSPSSQTNSSSVSALFILGDSSVNCENNGFLYNFLHDRSSTYSCSGFQAPLLPDLLGDKMGFPLIPPFYAQNGTIEGLLSGLNFGSAQATIMNTGSLGFQVLNHQLRQLFETLQILQLQLGQRKANDLIQSSVFYISLGKDDYIQLSRAIRKYGGGGFAHILVKQMIRVVKDLYNANARKIVCMGIGPLGCAPRSLWEAYNSSSIQHNADDRSYCVEEMNELILQYNAMLSEHLLDLNYELFDAQVIFCDVYQGMIEIINDPIRYGFSDVRRACCGLGRYGGMIGCLSEDMACNDPSEHVWWDFYNPTRGVNSLLANWSWSGQPFHLCHPVDIQQLAFTSAAEHLNRAAKPNV